MVKLTHAIHENKWPTNLSDSTALMFVYITLYLCYGFAKIPLEGCDSWKDILFTRAYKNPLYGVSYR